MRKQVDPFGISILDLLSNALGATILLMLIISVGTRGDSEKEQPKATDMGGGVTPTVQDARSGKKIDTVFYTVQLAFLGYRDSVSIADRSKNGWQVYRTDTSFSVNDTWLVKQNAPLNNQNLLQLRVRKSKAQSGRKVQVTIFSANNPVFQGMHEFKGDQPFPIDTGAFSIEIVPLY